MLTSISCARKNKEGKLTLNQTKKKNINKSTNSTLLPNRETK